MLSRIHPLLYWQPSGPNTTRFWAESMDFYIHRLPQTDPQPFALADGVMPNSLVPPQHMALLVHKIAGDFGLSRAAADKRGIIVVGHKTDILTVGLLAQM